MLKMAFQVVELTLDADQNVIDRKVIPYPYPTRRDAVDAIESVVTSFPQSGYQSENDRCGLSRETVLASGSS
jgi:hypothetical protein